MRKEQMPQFCKKCANVRTSLFGGEHYCKQVCKYNPLFQFHASHSYYRWMSGVGIA
ncbi:MAG: hypothetical protein HZA03_09315 [Nitrospinae bacterium]|nr:hypothetical protein [Nitrospinota bacterium]